MVSKGKLCAPSKSTNERFYSEKRKVTGIRIGITYLDRKNYGFKDLFKVVKGERGYLDDLNSFILQARRLNDIGEFIQKFSSHNKQKNEDEQSKNKIKNLQEKYKLEVDHLIHLHCKGGGNGEFVIHGFQIDNAFEIVWFDPKHEIHNK